jgi:oligopeptide transport system permease protein
MGRYVVRRLLQMIPVLLGATFIVYCAVFALPGDPFAGKCGDRPCPPSYIAAKTAEFNLNDPLLVQYVKFLGNLFTGNLGNTFTGQAIRDLIVVAYPTTMKLAFVAIMFELFVGIGLGILAGLKKGKFTDNFLTIGTLIVISIPVFVIGFVLQYVLTIKFPIFPTTVAAGAPWPDLILPGLVLASLSLAYVARLTRTSLVENVRSDYVRTATAKGLPRRSIIGKHALRNSLIPVVTFIGADFGALLGGAIVTEGIFNINGIGGLTFRSIRAREGATTTTIVTLLVLVFLIVNLLVDLLYAYLDPRIRYE